MFKEAELPGVNFGFVGAPLRYHTPRDDLRHADRRTLQHHGDNALAMLTADPAKVIALDLSPAQLACLECCRRHLHSGRHLRSDWCLWSWS